MAQHTRLVFVADRLIRISLIPGRCIRIVVFVELMLLMLGGLDNADEYFSRVTA